MGVGKSSVARHLAQMLGSERVDLDTVIERTLHRSVADIVDKDGIEVFRSIESECLRRVLAAKPSILSLGGGAWTIEANRRIIHQHGVITVWLESTFEHCWQNIRRSRKERPLARNKQRAQALFDERQAVYCLADWHFVIRPDHTSYDIARQICEEVLDLPAPRKV
jgi:shikimate kinase